MSQYQQRFGGIARLYGEKSLEIFNQSHVCVIGIGGVGSWATEALARSGIGTITLIDFDDICVTNTNRQVHTLTSSIGRPKAETMRERILAINPDCDCREIKDFITTENIANYISGEFDYVIDAIDSIKAKTALIAYCKRQKIKIITAGGAGGQIDPTQVLVTDLAKTSQDPLAAKVRSELRRFYHFTKNPKRKFGVDCVYSTEQLIYPDGHGGTSMAKPPLTTNDDSIRVDYAYCFGTASHVTATFGFVAASRVLKKLAEKT